MRGGVEALRTGVSPGDMDAAIAAQTLDGLSGAAVTDPHDGDVWVYHGGGWVNQPPSWNFGLENNDLTRWGKDNDDDWTLFARRSGSNVRSGSWCLRVTQSAPRRTMTAIDTQVSGTVEGQAVVFGASTESSYSGIIVPEGDTITVGFWIKAANGTSDENRVWLLSFQDDSEISASPLVLTTAYQHIELTYTAGSVEATVGAGAAVYIFFEGAEGHSYYIDDATFDVTPA